MLSKNSSQTKKIAAELAEKIVKQKPDKTAKVVALVGNLGAGKTTFTQGFAKGLGVRGRIMSPTFILFRRHLLRGESYNNFYHFDLYRIKKTTDMKELGFKEILADPKNIVLVEWPEKVKKVLPKDTIWVQFEYGQKGTERIIKVL